MLAGRLTSGLFVGRSHRTFYKGGIPFAIVRKSEHANVPTFAAKPLHRNASQDQNSLKVQVSNLKEMKTTQVFSAAIAASSLSLCSASASGRHSVNGLFESAPKPVQAGYIGHCHIWMQATAGMTCLEFIELTQVGSLEQFYIFNPQLEGDCQKNFWAGYHYCIRLSKSYQAIPTTICSRVVV